MRMCGIGDSGAPWSWFHMDEGEGSVFCTIIPSATESGTKTFDNKIREPDDVIVHGLVNEKDYGELNKIDEAIETRDFEKMKLTVVTRDAVYTDMAPVKITTKSVKDNWEHVEVTIRLQEIMKDDEGASGDDSVTRG